MTLELINEKLDLIRPFLKADEGDVELVEITEDKKVVVRLIGNCSFCTMKGSTIKLGIENTLKQFFPEIKEVVEV